jgi:hypothetical protein
MKERLEMRGKTIALGILSLAMTAAAVVAAEAPARDLWLHVNVRETAGGRVNVNLPVAVVEKVADLVPVDARRSGHVRMGEHDLTAAQLREVWRTVKNGPDATYVTVDEKDSKVRVAKSGRYLLVRTDDSTPNRSQVDVRIPVSVVEALLTGEGDELNVGAALRALARQGEGELVTVDDAKDTVRIWVDGAAESR